MFFLQIQAKIAFLVKNLTNLLTKKRYPKVLRQWITLKTSNFLFYFY
jgi:hypothetical protein